MLAALVVAGLAIGQLLQKTAPIGRDVSVSPAARAMLRDSGFPSAGPADADLVLVVFTDYQCPACRAAAPAMNGAVAADGNIRVIYRDWPIFGARSERAARVALAADRQGIYRPVHDALMAAPSLDEAALREAVGSAGGDWARIERDLEGQQAAIDELLARTRKDAFALGAPGTPVFLAGTLLVLGARDRRGFTEAFAQARELARG